MSGFKLNFLGTRGLVEESSPTHKFHSSILLEGDGLRILFDAGELHRYAKNIMEVKPTHVFLTHAHPDHAFALKNLDPKVTEKTPFYMTAVTAKVLAENKVIPEGWQGEIINSGETVKIGDVEITPYNVEHSLLAPAVCFRVKVAGREFTYAPDVLKLKHERACLGGIELYIGDGASITRDLRRWKKDPETEKPLYDSEAFGHASIKTQAEWCRDHEVPRIAFTHFGKEALDKKPEDLKETLEDLGVEEARDGASMPLWIVETVAAETAEAPTFPAYVGSKRRIVPFLLKRLPKDVKKVVDPMCGGCSFAYALKQKDIDLALNDISPYAANIAKAYLKNSRIILSEDEIAALIEIRDKDADVLKEHLGHWPKRLRIILTNIKRNAGNLKGVKRLMALVGLQSVLGSVIVKIGGSTLDFRFQKKPERILDSYALKLRQMNRLVKDTGAKVEAKQEDALKFLQGRSGDLLYLDPPYFGRRDPLKPYKEYLRFVWGWEIPEDIIEDPKNFIKDLLRHGRRFRYVMISYDGKDPDPKWLSKLLRELGDVKGYRRKIMARPEETYRWEHLWILKPDTQISPSTFETRIEKFEYTPWICLASPIEDLKGYDPAEIPKNRPDVLADDWRIVLGWYATLKDPEKEIKFTEEEIVTAAVEIFKEIWKRINNLSMRHVFNPREMKASSRELFSKAVDEADLDEKEVVEKSKELAKEYDEIKAEMIEVETLSSYIGSKRRMVKDIMKEVPEDTKTLFDPMCGFSHVLVEANKRGIKIQGNDLSPIAYCYSKAIFEGSSINIEAAEAIARAKPVRGWISQSHYKRPKEMKARKLLDGMAVAIKNYPMPQRRSLLGAFASMLSTFVGTFGTFRRHPEPYDRTDVIKTWARTVREINGFIEARQQISQKITNEDAFTMEIPVADVIYYDPPYPMKRVKPYYSQKYQVSNSLILQKTWKLPIDPSTKQIVELAVKLAGRCKRLIISDARQSEINWKMIFKDFKPKIKTISYQGYGVQPGQAGKEQPILKEQLVVIDSMRKALDLKAALESCEEEKPGIYLMEPHAEMLWTGEKTAIIKTEPFIRQYRGYFGQKLFWCGSKCYGQLILGEPDGPYDAATVRERFRSEHRISDEEWEKWAKASPSWNEPVYVFTPEIVERFPKPRDWKPGPRGGIQTSIRNVELVEAEFDPEALIQRVSGFSSQRLVSEHGWVHVCSLPNFENIPVPWSIDSLSKFHQALETEILRRGYDHHTPFFEESAEGPIHLNEVLPHLHSFTVAEPYSMLAGGLAVSGYSEADWDLVVRDDRIDPLYLFRLYEMLPPRVARMMHPVPDRRASFTNYIPVHNRAYTLHESFPRIKFMEDGVELHTLQDDMGLTGKEVQIRYLDHWEAEDVHEKDFKKVPQDVVLTDEGVVVMENKSYVILKSMTKVEGLDTTKKPRWRIIGIVKTAIIPPVVLKGKVGEIKQLEDLGLNVEAANLTAKIIKLEAADARIKELVDSSRWEKMKAEQREALMKKRTKLEPLYPFQPAKTSKAGYHALEVFGFRPLKKLADSWFEKPVTVATEVKFDFLRFILHKKGDQVRIWTEGGEEVSKNLPAVTADIKKLKCDSCILDSEGGPYGPKEEALGRRAAIAALGKGKVDDSRWVMHIFDLLYLDGEDLHKLPYSERRERLKGLELPVRDIPRGKWTPHLHENRVRLSKTSEQMLKDAKAAAGVAFSEGAMFKIWDSPYPLTGRTPHWAKYKKSFEIDAMIVARLPKHWKTGPKKGQKIEGQWIFVCVIGPVAEAKIPGKAVKTDKFGELAELNKASMLWDLKADFYKFKGKWWSVIGKTFASAEPLQPGAIIRVMVRLIRKILDMNDLLYHWLIPRVLEPRPEKTMPDPLSVAAEIARQSAIGQKPEAQAAEVEPMEEVELVDKVETWMLEAEAITVPAGTEIIHQTEDGIGVEILEDDETMYFVDDRFEQIVTAQKDPYMILPDEAKKWRFSLGIHVRGLSAHGDLRSEFSKTQLAGWTWAVVKSILPEMLEAAGKDKPYRKWIDTYDIDGLSKEVQKREPELVKELSKSSLDLSLEAIRKLVKRRIPDLKENFHDPLTKIWTATKAPEPHEWLTYEGKAPPGEVTATKELPGFIVIIEKGRVEFLTQKQYFHEYLYHGEEELLDRKFVTRKLFRPERWTKAGGIRFVWLTFPTKPDILPYVITKRAVDLGWMPPKGFSALPEHIRKQIPEELQYWKKNRPKSVRDKLFEEMKRQKRKGIDMVTMETPLPQLVTGQAKPTKFQVKRFWYRGPVVIRGMPTVFYALILYDGGITHWWYFDKDPTEQFGTLSHKERFRDKKFLEATGTFPPSHSFVKTLLPKTLDVHYDTVDEGKAELIGESDLFLRLRLTGKRLKGIYIFKRDKPSAAEWRWDHAELPSEEKKSEAVLLERQFVFQEHGWGEAKHWDLRLEFPTFLLDFAFFKSPLLGDAVRGVSSICYDKSWLRFEGEIPPGEPGNPTKNLTAYVKILDKGTYKLLKRSKDLLVIELLGKLLKGSYILKRMDSQWSFRKMSSPEVSSSQDRRGGAPRTDLQRVMQHYGVSEEVAKMMIEARGIENLLPPRMTGLQRGYVKPYYPYPRPYTKYGYPTPYGFYPRPYGPRYPGSYEHPRYPGPSDKYRYPRPYDKYRYPRPYVLEAKKVSFDNVSVWIVDAEDYVQVWRGDPKEVQEKFEVSQIGLPTDKPLPKDVQGFFAFDAKAAKWILQALSFLKKSWTMAQIEEFFRNVKPWLIRVTTKRPGYGYPGVEAAEDLERIKARLVELNFPGDVEAKAREILDRVTIPG